MSFIKPLLLSILVSCKVFADSVVVSAIAEDFPATFKHNEKWQGMDIEVIDHLLKQAQLNYEIVDRPFNRVLADLKKGDIWITPNLVKNDERSAYLNWLGPVRTTCIGLVVKKENLDLNIASLSDLVRLSKQSRKPVGYLMGASYSPFLDEQIKNNPEVTNQISYLNKKELQYNMLRRDRLIGFFADRFEVGQRIQNPDYNENYQDLALHTYILEESCTGAFIGVSRSVGENKFKVLEKAYQQIVSNQTLEKIRRKWMPLELSIAFPKFISTRTASESSMLIISCGHMPHKEKTEEVLHTTETFLNKYCLTRR